MAKSCSGKGGKSNGKARAGGMKDEPASPVSARATRYRKRLSVEPEVAASGSQTPTSTKRSKGESSKRPKTARNTGLRTSNDGAVELETPLHDQTSKAIPEGPVSNEQPATRGADSLQESMSFSA